MTLNPDRGRHRLDRSTLIPRRAMFNRRKTRKSNAAAAARYNELQAFLEDAQTFRGDDPDDVPDMHLLARTDERVYLCIQGAVLFESAEPPADRGATRGTPPAVDRGEFVVTSTRAAFTGTKQIRQWEWSQVVRILHAERGPFTSIDVSSRRRQFGVVYDNEHSEEIRFAIDLALATVRGERGSLIRRLSDEMTDTRQQLRNSEAAGASVGV